MVAPKAAMCRTLRRAGETNPVANSMRGARAATAASSTATSLRFQRSEMKTRRKPKRSADTPSSMPSTGVRSPVSSRASTGRRETTLPEMRNALSSLTTDALSVMFFCLLQAGADFDVAGKACLRVDRVEEQWQDVANADPGGSRGDVPLYLRGNGFGCAVDERFFSHLMCGTAEQAADFRLAPGHR